MCLLLLHYLHVVNDLPTRARSAYGTHGLPISGRLIPWMCSFHRNRFNLSSESSLITVSHRSTWEKYDQDRNGSFLHRSYRESLRPSAFSSTREKWQQEMSPPTYVAAVASQNHRSFVYSRFFVRVCVCRLVHTIKSIGLSSVRFWNWWS